MRIVVQPRWMGYYCEICCASPGCCCLPWWGVYKIIERINLLCVDARSQSLKDELTRITQPAFFFIDTIREESGHALGLMVLDIDF